MQTVQKRQNSWKYLVKPGMCIQIYEKTRYVPFSPYYKKGHKRLHIYDIYRSMQKTKKNLLTGPYARKYNILRPSLPITF